MPTQQGCSRGIEARISRAASPGPIGPVIWSGGGEEDPASSPDGPVAVFVA